MTLLLITDTRIRGQVFIPAVAKSDRAGLHGNRFSYHLSMIPSDCAADSQPRQLMYYIWALSP